MSEIELDVELGRDLVATAVLRGDFLLRSGQRSSYYIDKYLFTTQPALLRRIALALLRLVPPQVDRLAAPGFGALQLVTAMSLECGLPTLVVRTDQKEYGTAKRVEGAADITGLRVLLVEDVVTTGGAALEAVDQLRAAGADVVGALAVVDREQGGPEGFSARGVPFRALFTRTSLGL
jgi:orotate phosphoribosyltransferase